MFVCHLLLDLPFLFSVSCHSEAVMLAETVEMQDDALENKEKGESKAAEDSAARGHFICLHLSF